MKKRVLSTMIAVSAFIGTNFAQTADSTTATNQSKFTISGYVDSYYFLNANNPSTRSNTGASGAARGFDKYTDQFNLGMVQTLFRYENEKSEVVADINYGPNADYGNFGNARGYAGNAVYSGINIKQAYFKYNFTDKLSTTVGQFGTHIGYEYIDAPLNFHYSINHTFNAGIPFYHTGIKLNYKFNDAVSVMGGLVNGWDVLFDNNRAKSIIGQISLTPVENSYLNISYIGGNEADVDAAGKESPNSWTQVFDLNGSYLLGEKFTVGTWLMLGTMKGSLQNAAYGSTDMNFEKVKTWGGANLYTIYKFSDLFSLGLRAEYFDNTSGARPLRARAWDVTNPTQMAGTSVTSFTLTGNISLAKDHLLIKPEVRFDTFKKESGEGTQQYIDANGVYSKNSQLTYGAAFIYRF